MHRYVWKSDAETHLYRRSDQVRKKIRCVYVTVTAVHLGDMFQELRARDAILSGATVCAVVEKTQELRVQLEESTTNKQPSILLVIIHTDTETIHRSFSYTIFLLVTDLAAAVLNCGLLQSVAKQQVKPPVLVR